MPTARRVVAIASFNLICISLVLGGLEVYVRLTAQNIVPLGTDKKLVIDNAYGSSPGLNPGTHGKCYGAGFGISPLGFIEYAAPHDTSKASWLFMGDSITMGAGIDPNHSFTGLVASQCESLNIVNPSLIGYSSADYVNVVSALLSRPLNIRRVTIFWCLNDVYSNITLADIPGQQARLSGGSVLSFIKLHIMLFQWIKARFYDRSENYYAYDAAFYANPSDRHLASALADLSTVVDLCKVHAVQCDVVLLPYEYQLRKASATTHLPQVLLSQQIAGTGTPVFDPSAFLTSRSRNPADLYLYNDGIHFSKQGHQAMASFITTYLLPRS